MPDFEPFFPFRLARNNRRWLPSFRYYEGEKGLSLTQGGPWPWYQDVAGSVIANRPGDPVGLWKDRSGLGNHAVQAVALNRPVLGRHPASGLRNLANGAQAVNDSTYWRSPHTSNGTTATRVGYGIEDGIPYIDLRITGTVTTGEHTVGYLDAIIPTEANTTWTAKVTARVIAGTPVSGSIFGPSGVFPRVFEYAGATNVGNSVPAGNDAANDAFDRTLTVTRVFGATATSARATLILRTADTGTVDVTYRIKGLQFERGSTATALQYNVSQYDVTEPGYGDLWYVDTNGVNQWMNVPNVLWGGSDAMTLIVALAAKKTGAQAMIVEGGGNLSSRGFALIKLSDDRIRARSSGTAVALADSVGTVDGRARVYSAQSKISSSTVTLQQDGQLVAQSSASQGSGAFDDADLVLGAWGGSQYLSGRYYGIHAVNRRLSSEELYRAQKYLGRSCGVNIP